MSNAQKINKKLRNKSNSRTTRKGPRGSNRPQHGKGKSIIKDARKKKK